MPTPATIEIAPATAAQLARTASEWTRIAGEPVTVEEIRTTIYAFGSELAILRLFHKLHRSDVRAEYSKNLGTWFLSMERKI